MPVTMPMTPMIDDADCRCRWCQWLMIPIADDINADADADADDDDDAGDDDDDDDDARIDSR